MRLRSTCDVAPAGMTSSEKEHTQSDVEVEEVMEPMGAPPTLTVASDPGLVQPIHPLRSGDFWGSEIFIVWMFVCFTFSSEAPAWTMWREGIRITGPIVTVKDPGGNGDQEWVTVRDPATELGYTALITGHDHDIGTLATVIVHPRDRSKVSTPTTVYIGVVGQCVLLMIAIAYPLWAMVVHQRSRRSLGSRQQRSLSDEPLPER